jgi:hypothetical protein
VSLATLRAVTTISAIGGDCAAAIVDHATAPTAAVSEKTTACVRAAPGADAANSGVNRWGFMRSSAGVAKMRMILESSIRPVT